MAELLPLLQGQDRAHAGDTADRLGRIGHASAADAFERLQSHDDPDLTEIAVEACERIRLRSAN